MFLAIVWSRPTGPALVPGVLLVCEPHPPKNTGRKHSLTNAECSTNEKIYQSFITSDKSWIWQNFSQDKFGQTGQIINTGGANFIQSPLEQKQNVPKIYFVLK